MKNIFLYFFILIVISCKSDDEGNSATNLCTLYGDSVISGVEQIETEITIYQGSYDAYLLTATVKNNNDFAVNGEPNFVLKINDRVINYVPLGCRQIGPNSTCEIENTLFAEANEPFDNDVELVCFFYL